MGLDITAYSHLTHVGKHTDGWCEDEDHVQAYAYDGFDASFRGIPILGIDQQFIIGGCYAVTEQTERYGFRAGSYSGYNVWRDDLRRQFNQATEPDQPFYELIFFADNEGCIGLDAAKDLLADFEQHAGRYRPAQHEDYFYEKYSDWTRACRLAADGGLVEFH